MTVLTFIAFVLTYFLQFRNGQSAMQGDSAKFHSSSNQELFLSAQRMSQKLKLLVTKFAALAAVSDVFDVYEIKPSKRRCVE